MPEDINSRWLQVPSRNDYSGTIRGGNCDRNTDNIQHCSTCLLQYYTEHAQCQAHRGTSAGIYWTLRSCKVREWRNGGCVSQTWVVCELSLCHDAGLPGEEDGIIRDTRFTDEGVVSPPGLRRGLFTAGDTDTIDHNTSSTTSAEYVP